MGYRGCISNIAYFIGIIIISIKIVHDTVFQVNNEWDRSRTLDKNLEECFYRNFNLDFLKEIIRF